ncbi:hypothetical protein Glove_543g83 [Diversispora epigaea]|uniref:Uncharacterized protein n=1 Tax=Diversispora epigaea TaxID=1348612 RepID=A0A397GE13_9GLOM|nr:hypothetical protein Glove_543g83 [Diversispora epigaea]
MSRLSSNLNDTNDEDNETFPKIIKDLLKDLMIITMKIGIGIEIEIEILKREEPFRSIVSLIYKTPAGHLGPWYLRTTQTTLDTRSPIGPGEPEVTNTTIGEEIGDISWHYSFNYSKETTTATTTT